MVEKVDLLIKNGYVVTMDKEGRLFKNGAVAVSGNRIVAVDKTSSIEQKYSAERVIDAAGKIVMPGIVVSHCHTHGQASMGMPAEVEMENFYDELAKWWWPFLEDQLKKEDVYALAKYAITEMAKNGVTTVDDVMEAPKDLPGVLDAEGKAFLEVGMRGLLAFEATERISKENGKLGIQENVNFIKKWNDKPDALLRGVMCVHTVFSCSPEMLKEVKELADKYNAWINLHVEESMYEVEYSKKHFGKLPFEHLRDIGFLGPNVLAAQCVNTSDKEIKILKEYDVKVSHNIQTNMVIGVGLAPVPKMIDEGITVSLGNDGFYLDMFETIRTVYITHKGVLKDQSVLPPKKVLEMATIDGARAVGLENDIGSLEVGKKADIIVVDLNEPVPLNNSNIYGNIVSFGMGKNVKYTIIDGKIVVENQKVLTVDEEKVRKEAYDATVRIWTRNGFL